MRSVSRLPVGTHRSTSRPAEARDIWPSQSPLATPQRPGLGWGREVVALYIEDTALKRVVTVEEVAAFAVHMVSEEGGGFSGGTISLDGGSAHY